jgi:ribosome-associated translation inhibitor RaiA
VSDEVVEYARQRVGHLAKVVEEPILYARVKLDMAADPARTRPAIARALLDVNGRMVRAHVAAHDLHEAVDLLQRRLQDKLEHKGEHLEALRRHTPGRAEEDGWRHGDLPTLRPEYSMGRPKNANSFATSPSSLPSSPWTRQPST